MLYVLSRILEVENKEPQKNANSKYYLIKSEDGDFLFTRNELRSAVERAFKNQEDIPPLEVITQKLLQDRKAYYKNKSRSQSLELKNLQNVQKALQSEIKWYKAVVLILSIITFLTGLFVGLTIKTLI